MRKKALDDYVLYEEQTLQASAQSQIDMLIKQRAQEQKVDAGNQKERQRIAEELAFEILPIYQVQIKNSSRWRLRACKRCSIWVTER